MIKLHFPPITFQSRREWKIGQGSVVDEVRLSNDGFCFHDVTQLHYCAFLFAPNGDATVAHDH